MSIRFKSFTSAAALAAPLLLSGCDGSVRRDGPQEEILQVVRVDAKANRRWVLNHEALTVYDNVNRRRLRRIALPDWTLAGPPHACPPDLVLDASGAVYVSSNVVPVLWRVEPQGFQVTRIALQLNHDADKDVGFTRLFVIGDGTLLAAGATFESLWRLDLPSATASKLSVPRPHLAEHDQQRDVVRGLQDAAEYERRCQGAGGEHRTGE